MTCDPSTLEVKSGVSRVQGQPDSKLEVPLGFVKPCYNQQTSLQYRWCIQTFRQGTGVILYSVLYWLSVLFTKEWWEALAGRKGWGFTVSGLPIGVSCWLPLVVLSTGDYTMRKLQMIPPEGSRAQCSEFGSWACRIKGTCSGAFSWLLQDVLWPPHVL